MVVVIAVTIVVVEVTIIVVTRVVVVATIEILVVVVELVVMVVTVVVVVLIFWGAVVVVPANKGRKKETALHSWISWGSTDVMEASQNTAALSILIKMKN